MEFKSVRVRTAFRTEEDTPFNKQSCFGGGVLVLYQGRDKFLVCADERRARLQPGHIALAIMRASAPEVRLSPSFVANSARKEMTSPSSFRKAYLSGF
jgi:hypothetical protein